MTAWTSEELDKIGQADELELQSLRRDGTLRDPVTIWVVRVNDDLYVRAVRGRNGPWFRSTQIRHEGRIRAGGVDKEVRFVNEPEAEINDRIDAAVNAKYGHYRREWVDPLLTAEARTGTLKLLPR